MEYKKVTLIPVIISVSLLLLSACAGKMAVTDTPADETDSAATEPAPAQDTGQAGADAQVVEVIPLDATTAESTPDGNADTGVAKDNSQEGSAKNKATQPPPQETVPAPDITGIIDKFLDHRNTLWHSRDNTYRLYVGDQFATEYSPGNKTFVIRSDEAGSDLECKYTMDGKLDPQQDGLKKACSTLITKLDNYVTNF